MHIDFYALDAARIAHQYIQSRGLPFWLALDTDEGLIQIYGLPPRLDPITGKPILMD